MQNKVAIVTGGSRGIGAAIAKRLLDEGAKVIIGSRTEEELKETVKGMSVFGKIDGFVLDVCNRESIQIYVKEVISRYGRVDILVNCAGVNLRLPADSYPEEEWDRVLNINLSGVYRMCQEVGHVMIEQKYGKIVNITSMMAHTVTPNQSAYASSKAAVAQYTKLLAVEWGKYNINVNAVSPGYLDTEMTRKMFENQEYRNKIINQTPHNRLGQPEEIADAVVFLASERANFIHGTVLPVDGGFLAGFPSLYIPTT